MALSHSSAAWTDVAFLSPHLKVPRALSKGTREGCPGPRPPLPGPVLLGLCFIASQPQHTLLGEVEMFPLQDPGSFLGRSVLLPILSGTACASASKKSSPWHLL